MKTFLTERFLTQFFLIKAILNGIVCDKTIEKVFSDLVKIFCLPLKKAERDALFTAIFSEPFANINDNASYLRLCRTVEFANITLNENDRMIFTSLGEAMGCKDSIFTEKNLTASSVADRLDRAAMSGNVSAMATLSYFENRGILVQKDKAASLRRMALVADWNHVFGNLLALSCTGEDMYLDNLYTILDTPNQRAAVEHICSAYKMKKTCRKKPRVKILETAFEMQVLDRNQFHRKLSKILFSDLISNEDKKKLILDAHAEEYLKIPFDAKVEEVNFYQSNFKPFKGRREERENILCAMSPVWCECEELYRPLMLVESGEAQASGIYYEALKNSFSHVVEVDAATLTPQDFFGGEQHFVLRALGETGVAATVILMKNAHLLDEALLEEFAKLLRRDFREKFKLANPAINFDLSRTIFVLFSNRIIREFESSCQVISVKPLERKEKSEVIGEIFANRAMSLNRDIKLTKDAVEVLSSISMVYIPRVVDDLLRCAIFKNKAKICTEDIDLSLYNVEKSNEFGYFGGAYEKL
ncbi:MAG: hypothetical protein IKU84_03295 [Clostridia bacterium]|nr:hypothetical protein [Clostridia bacterium]